MILQKHIPALNPSFNMFVGALQVANLGVLARDEPQPPTSRLAPHGPHLLSS